MSESFCIAQCFELSYTLLIIRHSYTFTHNVPRKTVLPEFDSLCAM